MASDFTTKVFGLVDDQDAAAVAALFAADGSITFGNNPPLVGAEQIEAGIRGFYGTIGGLSHDVVQEWNMDGDSVIELRVTYTRRDGATVTIPCVSIWNRAADGLIATYRVYFDLTPVYA
jgi:ketosteroid isomerase-like protein